MKYKINYFNKNKAKLNFTENAGVANKKRTKLTFNRVIQKRSKKFSRTVKIEKWGH